MGGISATVDGVEFDVIVVVFIGRRVCVQAVGIRVAVEELPVVVVVVGGTIKENTNICRGIRDNLGVYAHVRCAEKKNIY